MTTTIYTISHYSTDENGKRGKFTGFYTSFKALKNAYEKSKKFYGAEIQDGKKIEDVKAGGFIIIDIHDESDSTIFVYKEPANFELL